MQNSWLSIFFDSKGDFMWEGIAAIVATFGAVSSLLFSILSYRNSLKTLENQKIIEQKKIDADLKAKSRIEWINGVRKKSSELIFLLLSLRREDVNFLEQWLKVEESSELLKLYFNSSSKRQIESEVCVNQNEIIVTENGKKVLYNENENKDKHIYIRRYIECLIELYQSESYKYILKNSKDVFRVLKESSFKEADYRFRGIDSDEEAKEFLNESDLDDYRSNKLNLESSEKIFQDLTQKLVNYKVAVDNFSEIIGIYLKIEWDKAKQGK